WKTRPAPPPARPRPRRGTGDIQQERFSSILSYSRISLSASRGPTGKPDRGAEEARRSVSAPLPPLLRHRSNVAGAGLTDRRHNAGGSLVDVSLVARAILGDG